MEEAPDTGFCTGKYTSACTTAYVYDAAGRLRSVTQGTQNRSFNHDLAGRLLSANNPESGVWDYAYDNNGNLKTRSHSKWKSSSTILYDKLNRPISKSFVSPSDGAAGDQVTPSVTYCYDGKTVDASGATCVGTPQTQEIGQLTSTGTSDSRTDYSHDLAGRVTGSVQRTSGLPEQSFSYDYYLSDAMASELYPSGRRVTTCPDGNLRPWWVSAVKGKNDCIIGTPPGSADVYAKEMLYEAGGASRQMTLGNTLVENVSHNVRQQPERLRLGTTANTANTCSTNEFWCVQLGYTATGVANNGNIRSQTMALPGGISASQNYLYDPLNRLTETKENSGASFTHTSDYDRYGNRIVAAHSGTGLPAVLGYDPTNLAAFSGGQNQITGADYDAAGNLKGFGGQTLLYDAEGRVKTVREGGAVTTAYAYDGEGRRVKKTQGAVTTYYVYDAMGSQAVEYNGTVETAGRQYITQDHLGSTRLVTSDTGAVVRRFDYLPFGGELPAGVGARTTAMNYATLNASGYLPTRFTGKERELRADGSDMDLDYFGARYYGTSQGRFASPDRPFVDQSPWAPQSWNLYAYVRNNPLSFLDPTGRGCVADVNGEHNDSSVPGPDCDQVHEADKAPVNNGPDPNNKAVEGNTATGDSAPLPLTKEWVRQVSRDLPEFVRGEFTTFPAQLSLFIPVHTITIGPIPVLQLGVTPTFTTFPNSGQACLGFGLAVSTPGRSANLALYDIGTRNPTVHDSVVSGFGWSATAQMNPLMGIAWASSGGNNVAGPSLGIPGLQVGYGNSSLVCWQL